MVKICAGARLGERDFRSPIDVQSGTHEGRFGTDLFGEIAPRNL
jgi:hypothetical protein